MTIQGFLNYISRVATKKHNLWGGFGVTHIEYGDRDQELRVVFGYYEQQDVWYELLMKDVFYFSKYDEELPNKEGELWPEEQKFPFINTHSDSKLLSFLKKETGIQIFYEKDASKIKHYEIIAQNIILNTVALSEPEINIISEDYTRHSET